MAEQPQKVFVFALPRSGSTMLCDLLTVPGQSVILHEPMLLRRFGDGRQHRIRHLLSEIGIEIDFSPEHFTRGTPARPWYDEHVLPKFGEYDFWGIKEVYLTDAEQLIELYQPDQILLLWRDPRDTALSFLELMNRSLMCYADRKTLKDEAWAMECLRASAEVLSRIASTTPHMRLRYEDLIESSDHRQALLDYVGMAEFSDVSLSFVDDPQGIRGPEIERHRERWSTRSLHRWNREPAGWRRSFARVCHCAMQRDAGSAGYAESELSAGDVCAATAGGLEQRLGDPNFMPEPQFDFAYARRRARKRVAPLLDQGSAVLDVGASTAALAFMVTNVNVTVIDDGESGKRLLSKPWREGVFPKLAQFDAVTFLFSLEYVDDPLLMVKSLLDRRLRVLITYHCSDDLSAHQRDALQFSSHLSRADWTNFASMVEAGFSCQWVFDGFQSLICLEPQDK